MTLAAYQWQTYQMLTICWQFDTCLKSTILSYKCTYVNYLSKLKERRWLLLSHWAQTAAQVQCYFAWLPPLHVSTSTRSRCLTRNLNIAHNKLLRQSTHMVIDLTRTACLKHRIISPGNRCPACRFCRASEFGIIQHIRTATSGPLVGHRKINGSSRHLSIVADLVIFPSIYIDRSKFFKCSFHRCDTFSWFLHFLYAAALWTAS